MLSILELKKNVKWGNRSSKISSANNELIDDICIFHAFCVFYFFVLKNILYYDKGQIVKRSKGHKNMNHNWKIFMKNVYTHYSSKPIQTLLREVKF